MRNSAWDHLVSMINGEPLSFKPVGFIIDSPWIPGWYGISMMDYYSSDELWLKSNMEALRRFPDVWFMPGFWSEYGMCTEPSAFGSRMVFAGESLPHAGKVIRDITEAGLLPQPDVRTDVLLPFVINRLRINEKAIKASDHQIRFAVTRGPLNIASFLMGTSEFMMALAVNPEESHRLLDKITRFICDWLEWQKECFPSIDGVLVLDDIIGFVGDAEFSEFVTPYFTKIFNTIGPTVRFLHNDADGLITASSLKAMNVNMFNFSFNHTIGEIRMLAGPDAVLVGNIPPRDVMAAGSPGDVKNAVARAFAETDDYSRIIWSVGGGMPPGVRDENIRAFVEEVKKH